jgi:hypothetical protein
VSDVAHGPLVDLIVLFQFFSSVWQDSIGMESIRDREEERENHPQLG